MNKISKSIKKFRAKKGLSQNELADILFVSRQTVSSWENGRTQPDIESLEKLSEALSVSVEELIYGEKPKLIETEKEEKSKKIIITIFSVFASLLVGVGGVLVFFNYWSEFPVAIKTAFSVLPMVVGQVLAVFTFIKKYDKVYWREGSSAIWAVGVIASVALLDQVLLLPTDFATCTLIDAILVLPIVFILTAVAPLTIYNILVLIYGFVAVLDYTVSSVDLFVSTIIFFVLIALGASYTFIHRKESDDSRHIYSVWLTVISCAITTFIVAALFDTLSFVPIFAGLLFLLLFKNKWNLSKPVKIIVPLVTTISELIFVIKLVDILQYGLLPFSDMTLFIMVLLVASVIIAIVSFVLLIKNNFGDKIRILYVLITAVFFAISILVPCFAYTLSEINYELFYYIVSLIIIVQGVTLFLIGAKELNFFNVNVGLLTVSATIIQIMLMQDMDLLVVGVIMIALGLCLFAINYKLVKLNKQENLEVKENE